ncbi:MAG: hypothetical protein IJD69_02850 [Alphaproteobacteria bacterium]|nr:hypothetical protein [Alphaproteobacteria bacterium]
MKVKNVVFSGFMAAILMSATGTASAAISVASQGYVDAQVDAVEASVSNTYLTKTDAADTYLTETQVTEQITNVVGTTESGILADVAANKSAIAALDDKYATDTALSDGLNLKEDSANKTTAITDENKTSQTLFPTLGAITSYTDQKVADIVAGDMKDALDAYATTQDVADDIADALNTAQGYADAAEAAAIAAAKTAGDVAYDVKGAAAAAQSAAEATAAAALNEYKTTNDAAVQKNATDIKTNADAIADINTELSTMATSETVTALTTRVGTAESDIDKLEAADTEMSDKISANETAISDLQNDLATKIDAPAACETQDCVLSINKASGTISWVPLTEPVADFME